MSKPFKRLCLWLVIAFAGLDESAAQIRPEINTLSTGRVGYVYMMDHLLDGTPEYPIHGTPYMEESFAKGQLQSELGNLYGLEMRYNIYYDRMEYNQHDTMFVIAPNLLINKVVMGQKTFVVENYETRDGVYPSFFIRLDSGDISLLTKMEVVFKDRQQGRPIQGTVPAKYSRKPDVNYIRLSDGSLKKIRNMKKLIQSLPDHRSEMEIFAEENNISAKNEEELIRFIQYYNSLE